MHMRMPMCLNIVFFCLGPSWKIDFSNVWPLEKGVNYYYYYYNSFINIKTVSLITYNAFT